MLKYKEVSFPVTYRAGQVRDIMAALARRRSVSVLGLAGMGKSNLFRFLAAHPQVQAHYLGSQAKRFVFVLVDCNLVDAGNEAAVLEQLDDELDRAGLALPKHSGKPKSLRRSVQRRLEQVNPATTIVVLFDPLDNAFRLLEAHFWTYLRALRDMQGNVAFILGARRPPPPLAELQELIALECWVVPLNRQDAMESLARDEKRLGRRFTTTEKKVLRELSGGHPGLLKNLAEAVGSKRVSVHAPRERILDTLLQEQAIRPVCFDMWSDLQPSERYTMQCIALHSSFAIEPRTTAFLQQAGLVQMNGGTPEVFSPLWQAYVESQIEQIVRIHVQTEGNVQLESWQGTQSLELSGGLYQLLQTMASAPKRVHSHAQLSQILYPGDPRYSREALTAQVKRLRKALNASLIAVTQDQKFKAILPESGQGYRLNLNIGNGWQVEYQVNS